MISAKGVRCLSCQATKARRRVWNSMGTVRMVVLVVSELELTGARRRGTLAVAKPL